MILQLFVLATAVASADVSFIKEERTLAVGKSHLDVVIKRPTGTTQKNPVVLLFGGFQTSHRSLDLVNPTRPVVIVTFSYPLKGPKKINIVRDYNLVPKVKSALHQTLHGIETLIAWVKTQPDMDPDKIYLAGISLGAPLTAMSVNEGIKGLILVHGFIDIENTMSYSLGRRFEKKYGALGKHVAPWLAWWATWYLDLPSARERLQTLTASQRVLIYTSREDDLLPPSAADDIRAALKKSKAHVEERFMSGAHIRSNETEMIESLVGEILRWMD